VAVSAKEIAHGVATASKQGAHDVADAAKRGAEKTKAIVKPDRKDTPGNAPSGSDNKPQR
jgi:hypothetical protein